MLAMYRQEHRPWGHVDKSQHCPLFYFIVIFYFLIYFYIYFWLCWVFISVRGLSLVAASGGHSSSRCVGLSLSRPLLLWSTSSRRAGSVVVAHGPSCSAACGIFPDQGSNPCTLHWQADSQPLGHQGSPSAPYLISLSCSFPICKKGRMPPGYFRVTNEMMHATHLE